MKTSPGLSFILCQGAGFGLLLALWLIQGGEQGFFLFLILLTLAFLRLRVKKARFSVFADIVVCLIMPWEYAVYALALPLFQAMYLRVFPAVLAIFFLFTGFCSEFDMTIVMIPALGALSGLFLGFWDAERRQKLNIRDAQAGRYYDLESSIAGNLADLSQVERLTAVAERARIARDIHDNAGHEIVAAYISLQTARSMFSDRESEALELYDAALDRLNKGANKIREAVHNLSTITFVGAEKLEEICRRFPVPVELNIYGDAGAIPVYVWTMLEICLNESLTNAARHSKASYVKADLDATPHIVRLCVENDGVLVKRGPMGTGLRNLRHRAANLGGSLSIDAGEVFRVICVIPVRADEANPEKEDFHEPADR